MTSRRFASVVRRYRPKVTVRDRFMAVRRSWRSLVRLIVAASLSWALATYLFGHEQAFFAPISAVIVIRAGNGLRIRTLVELIVGVSLGVLVAELLLGFIGRGTWQLGLVVGVAATAAVFAYVGGLSVIQAANSAILVVAIVPPPGATDPALTRFIDCLIGGLIGLALIALLPRNAVRDLDREVQTLLRTVARILGRCARALRRHDQALADEALAEARATQPLVDSMLQTAEWSAETTRIAPLRWRQRSHLRVYSRAVDDLDNAMRDVRVLARRVRGSERRGHDVPPEVATAMEELASGIAIYADDLLERDDFSEATEMLVKAAQRATSAMATSSTVGVIAICVQIRSLAGDMLFACGLTPEDYDTLLGD